MSLLESLNFLYVRKENYKFIELMNRLSDEEIKNLDLDTLNHTQLNYLSHVDLVKMYPHPWSNSHNPDGYYRWTGKPRKPFNMEIVKIWDPDKDMRTGGAITFELPPWHMKRSEHD